MIENGKPEWFQIAENDGPALPAKATKALPLAAFVAASLIIGLGTVITQSHEESPANASELVAASNSASSVVSPTQPAESAARKSIVSRIIQVKSSTTTTSTPGLINPSIAMVPEESDDEGDDD